MQAFKAANGPNPVVPEDKRNAIILQNLEKAAAVTAKNLSKEGEKVAWPKGTIVVCRYNPKVKEGAEWEFEGTVEEIDTTINRVWVKWTIPPPGEKIGDKSKYTWGNGQIKRAPWLEPVVPSKQPFPASLLQISPDINRTSSDLFAETLVASPPKRMADLFVESKFICNIS